LLKGKRFASTTFFIEKEKIVFSELVSYGDEHGAPTQWPKLLKVVGDEVKIEYTVISSESMNLANVPISWE